MLPQYLLTGICVGFVYALIGLGIVLIFKSTGVLNLAQGEMVLLLSWISYSMLVQVGLPPWLGIPAVIVIAIFLGWLIERFAMRPLIAQPILSLIVVTLGLIYLFRGIVFLAYPKAIAALPRLFPLGGFQLGSVVLSYELAYSAIICLVLFGLLSIFFRYHRTGIAMRASADDQFAVQACGVPVTSMFSWSWIFSCVTAAIGGILLSLLTGVTLGLAASGLSAFPVVLLGGLDSFLGCVIAGPIVGICEYVGGGYLDPYIAGGVKEVIPFFIILIVMFIKPYGLFGQVRIERI
jgi:branched-chain amino acid transport system permease protein